MLPVLLTGGGGSIINTASVAGVGGGAAGAVETNIMQSVDQTKMDPAGSARCNTYYAAIPGQLKPEDIADLALFLASDESKKINGAIIPADAGWLSA